MFTVTVLRARFSILKAVYDWGVSLIQDPSPSGSNIQAQPNQIDTKKICDASEIAKNMLNPSDQGVACECCAYSNENLKLGKNEIYREHILSAASRSNLSPQSIAALIDAEAAKDRDGVWKADSQNPNSSAKGLTQILDGTWKLEGNKKGSYLNGVAKEKGYLDEKGKIKSEYMDDFLDLRSEPEISIAASADMAASNINDLKGKGLVSNESPPALAKYAYLAHHEGPTGAASFIRGDIDVSDSKFNGNVPQSVRQTYLDNNNNDQNEAYRSYMSDYIDRKIDVTKFMNNSDGISVEKMGTLLQ